MRRASYDTLTTPLQLMLLQDRTLTSGDGNSVTGGARYRAATAIQVEVRRWLTALEDIRAWTDGPFSSPTSLLYVRRRAFNLWMRGSRVGVKQHIYLI